MCGLETHLGMSEAQRCRARCEVRLITQTVPRLLGRRTVVAQPIRLHHEIEIGPVEVDVEAVHFLLRRRRREPHSADDRQETSFELRVGESERAPVEQLAQERDAGLVDGSLELPPIEPGPKIDEGADWAGGRNALATWIRARRQGREAA